jgi:hypothetical protein
MIVKDILSESGIQTNRKGDDIYVNGKKLSVSIATCSNSSMKIHFGMNITNKGTPADIETIGLSECRKGVDDQFVQILIDKISESYINEIESIEEDISKTKVF